MARAKVVFPAIFSAYPLTAVGTLRSIPHLGRWMGSERSRMESTADREFLPFEAGCPLFINADLIAAGLSPFNPEAAAFRAGRLMLAEIDRNAAAGRSFAFETTLSGHS
jgi:predicted ABC-type ATPase